MVFSGGVPWNPPLCTNGSAGYLMQLSVNVGWAIIGNGQIKYRVVYILPVIFRHCYFQIL